MFNLIRKIFQFNALAEIEKQLQKNSSLHLRGVKGSFRAFIAAYITEVLKRPVLYIASDLESAECMRDDLEIIIGGQNVCYLPALEFEPYDPMESNPALIGLRMEAVQVMLSGPIWAAVSTCEGIISALPSCEDFVDHQIYLKTGNEYKFNVLIEHLNNIGCKRTDIVEKPGDFSIRGGIIDIYSWNYEEPVRVEFYADKIESMRYFDVFSQRSKTHIAEITLLPNIAGDRAKTFIDSYLPKDTIVFFEDRQVFEEKSEKWLVQAYDKYQLLKNSNIEEDEPELRYLKLDKARTVFKNFHQLDTNLITADSGQAVDFKSQPHPEFSGSLKNFIQYINKNKPGINHNHYYILFTNQTQSERLKEILDEEELAFNGKFIVPSLHGGFLIPDLGIQILTDHEIFKRFKQRKTLKRFKNGEYIRSLSGLKLYDYVVHIDYGIGQYHGMETVQYGDVKKECIKIIYQDNDILYVTVDRLNRVQKYSTEASGLPKLTKLGGTEWERNKKKTKESLKKIASELINIYAGRKATGGFEFSDDNHWQKELEASFIFEETEDQLRSVSQVKADMQKSEPMDRLLCGDVGFGKTEVAIRAAFKAVMDGKQAAVLVPTTILAFQHLETFRERVKEFPVQIELLNRFRSQKEQKQILENLEQGKVDIIIGTHRLLSDDVKFKDLGLLIIDEEQRFGVKHKEKLKKYRLSVDILSMTATPIPRTLHMALMGARDLSHIDTPPRNRLPVHTEIIYWNQDKLREIIRRELDREGQVYFVHNRVETIETMRETIQQIVPEARIVTGHGQLPERRLEKVMFDFMHKKYDVLVASMIIENGLDIPNVNTIIINRADKFGLSQLYQLRGRVGRANLQAYAYLLAPPLEKITEVARKRLRAILDFTELGSGYKVALRDLEIRGAGNLLGKEQSGFVQSVGFELYCKILNEAVKEIKQGQSIGDPEFKSKSYTDPKIDTDYDLLIPEEYIPNDLERISIYHRLVNFSEIEQIEELKEELSDRYGKIPDQVINFLMTIELKVLAGRLYSERFIKKGNRLKMIFSEQAQQDDDFFSSYIPKLMKQNLTQVKFLNQDRLGVEITIKGESLTEQLSFSKKLLQTIVNDH